MATNNAINVGLSGATGTGSFVGSTSPTLVTPTLGAATATSVTFSPTTGGIVGTTTNDNAGAGMVGEYISSTVLVGSAVSVTSAISKTITSISLTAGDWDVSANIVTNPAAGTTTSAVIASMSTVDNTLETAPNGGFVRLQVPIAASTQAALGLPTIRVSVASTTTIYLVASISFAVSTMSVFGFIGARRVR
jgi:hypothetical protein